MPFFARNSLLQKEQVNSENDDTDGDPLALALRSLRFRSASQTLFASSSSSPLLMRLHHFAPSSAICSQDSSDMLKSFSGTFRVSL